MEKRDFYIDMKGLVSGNDGPPFTSIDRSIKKSLFTCKNCDLKRFQTNAWSTNYSSYV